MLDPNSVAAIVSAIGASAAAVAAWCALRPAQRAAKAASLFCLCEAQTPTAYTQYNHSIYGL